MEIVNLFLPSTNQFATDYSTGNPSIDHLFHYSYAQPGSYEERVQDLQSQVFKREELADYIHNYMNQFPTSIQIEESIGKLRKENSVVVIGGQQAGILTGPLYSIHKILSIILFARKKEKELNIPVVPVFWIAGEDHDYDEVNHVYIEKEQSLAKITYPERLLDKRMVTDISLNQDVLRGWVNDIVTSFGETQFTNNLLDFTDTAIRESKTFVDFFAHIVMMLFKEYGLLIVDSGDKGLRQLESKYLLQLIDQAKTVTEKVKTKQNQLQLEGIPNTITISDHAANLFYYDEENKERILLEYLPEQDAFSGKDGSISFQINEIRQIAKDFPEKLSNNVVTRPLMQEWLFPSLAFIAGPGEIAYWAELKDAFEHFGMKMPPIVPRLNITLVERNIASDVEDLDLSLQDVLTAGTDKHKEIYLDRVRNGTITELFNQTKQQLLGNYQELENVVEIEYKGMLPLLRKNEQLILSQIEFMEQKLEISLRQKHEVMIEKYDRLQRRLKPNGSPQERMWNIYYFLNQHGLAIIDELLMLGYRFFQQHCCMFKHFL